LHAVGHRAVSDRGRKTVDIECGCRLVLVAMRWVRVVTCGGGDCKARLAAEKANAK
jgi:hypothetical protein